MTPTTVAGVSPTFTSDPMASCRPAKARIHTSVRQRDDGEDDLADQVIPAGANADCNGERQTAGNREARILEEHPESELVVLKHVYCPVRSIGGQLPFQHYGRTEKRCTVRHNPVFPTAVNNWRSTMKGFSWRLT